MEKLNNTDKTSGNADKELRISDVMTSLPKIRVRYMTEFGGRVTILELEELLPFTKKFKCLSLEYIFSNES
jgi:hypothetical protein